MSKLYLHIGHNKTGSSFLQSVFAKNATLLRANNIIYPGSKKMLKSAASGKTTSGNKQKLYAKLKEDKPFLDDPHSYLFSGEILFAKFVEDEFVDACANAAKTSGKTVSILFFIRDPIDQQLSRFMQKAQGGKVNCDLDTYLQDRASGPQLHTFKCVQSVCTACKVNGFELNIHNYTRSQSDLISNTKTFLGLDDSVELGLPSHRVNRRVGAMELGVARAMRKSFSPFETPEHENYLTDFADATPNVKWPPLEPSKTSLDQFSSEIVQSMNETNEYLARNVKYQLTYPKKSSGTTDPTEEYGFMLGSEIVRTTLKILVGNLQNEDKMTVLDNIFSSSKPELTDIRQYAFWLFAEKDYERAIPVLQQLVALDPKAANYLKLARCFRKTGQLEESIKAARLAFKKDPTLEANVIFLVETLLENRQKRDADDLLKELESNRQTPGISHFIAYKQAMANNNVDKATLEITAAVECNPDSKRYKAALKKLNSA